jgi:RNA polymerase sigma factor (sigma-70 family)
LLSDVRKHAGVLLTYQTESNAMTLGDQHECFERWMADHIAILYRVVNGFAEGADRSDLMQEIMLAVWKAIPSFRGQSQATTFLYRVSHNAALTWHRKQRTYARRAEMAEAPSGTEESGARTNDERLEELYGAIRELAEVDRSLILLSLDGLSYQEMSNIHGLSESNVGVRLNRIKQRLAKTMNQKEIHEPR